MIETLKERAFNCHRSTNHFYDDKPYEYHLEMVAEVAKKFIHLIPEKYRDIVITSCYFHDVIEDTRQTYNDVKNATCLEVAEIVYALTNEKGKTRKERANDKYYQGIRDTQFATFVKMCDRIANIQYSMSTRSGMLEMYRKETPNFINKIYDERYDEMFEYLENLVGLKSEEKI
jgi:(p)ppGpp synthase/HD superfamily hydrolase